MLDLSFKLAPEEALSFWRDKIKLSPGEFSDLSREAKIKAFAVSGIAKGDELNTVFNAIEKSLKDGRPFSEFQSECAGIFERRGWTGQRAWRVDNIFRTNIQTAYNTGRYQQMRLTKDARPFWRYSAVNDKRTRPEHRAVHGKIFPADHPFWDTWYPPNGFRCRCSVNSVSQENLDVNGWKAGTKDPTGKLYEPTDPVTGVKMPARLLLPDYGWDFNPAKVSLGGLDHTTGSQGPFKDLDSLKGAANYGRRSLVNVRPSDLPHSAVQPLAKGLGNDVYKAEFEKLYGSAEVLTDPLKEPVLLSLRSFKVFKEAGAAEVWKFDKSGHGESIPLLRNMIEEPFEIWLTPQINEAGRVRLAKRFISLWRDEGGHIGGLAMFEVIEGQFQGITSFLPIKKNGASNLEYLEKQRAGLLLYNNKGR